MTVIELLVASTLSLLVVGMTVAATLANRGVFSYDLKRTQLNQNLRGAFDLLTAELRQAGERLPPGFPAIVIRDNVSASSDQLILRRNLLDEILTVCEPVSVGGTSTLYLSSTTAGAPPACTYGSQDANFDAWHSYRIEQPGDQMQAFIYDFTTQNGEFFTVGNDGDTGTQQYIQRVGGSWENAYTIANTAVYILREWSFQLSTTAGQTDLLQIVENEDDANPRNVAFSVDSFRALAWMQAGPTLSTLGAADGWTNLRAVEITIQGSESYKGRIISTTLSSRLFPRNILSN